jgi:hypothetical protein
MLRWISILGGLLALAFNRVAQENFEKHACAQSTHDETLL